MVEPRAIATGLTPGQVLGEARNSDEMLAIWRATREKIGLSLAHCDELANFTSGQCDKILGPSESKNFGPLTFTGLNWVFAVKWVCVVDTEQLAVMAPYWKDRQRQIAHVRSKPNRVSKQIIARAKPIVLKEIGEKLASAFGDDIGQILLGMKPPELVDQPAAAAAAEIAAPVPQQIEHTTAEPTYAAVTPTPPAPSSAPKAPEETHSHLRVISFKRGRRFG